MFIDELTLLLQKKNDKLEAEISALKPEKPHSSTAGISGSMLDIHRELMIKEAELSSVRTTLALRTTELESSKAANQRLEDEVCCPLAKLVP